MKLSFVAFDFETANSSHSSACEIGLVKVKDGVIIDKFHSLIKPPNNYYDRANTLIHGLNPEQTKDAPTFKEIWPTVRDFIADNLLVAHNISYDATILYHTLDFYSIESPEYQGTCTYEIFGRSLTETCQAFGIERQYHNALIDAEACALIYLKHLNGIVPDFSCNKSKSKSNLFDFSGHDRIKGEFLTPDYDHGDSDCPFYKQKVVITGVFSKVSRHQVASLLKEKGADIDTTVTERTRFLVSGTDPGPSKIRKIETLRSKGHDISIINEEDFLRIIKFNH